jgi:glycosyltransferase involved in cell wall biosynthesis
MKKIHYHSDCYFFAGCENMLSVFFNSEHMHATCNLSFSFRYSKEYIFGFSRRVKSNFPVYPLNFLDLSDPLLMPKWVPVVLRPIVIKLLGAIIRYPLMAYEIYVLTRLFNKIKPDVLHINNGGYPAALSARAAAIAGKFASVPKVVMVVNNMATDYTNVSRWYDFPIDCIVVKAVDLFITGSKLAAIQLKSVLNLPDKKIISIHNGIPQRLGIESLSETRSRLGLVNFEGVVFGVVALLIPRKGHQVLLDAVLKLSKHVTNESNTFKILIEGHGPLRDDLISFVNKHELNKYVEFVGDEKNIIDFMTFVDVLILPSIANEDFPNVVLEAMALGKPVIASRLAGIPEQVIQNETGLLVNPGDVAQLAQAIADFSSSPSLRMRLGQEAAKRFKALFAESVAVKNYLMMYEKLTEAIER